MNLCLLAWQVSNSGILSMCLAQGESLLDLGSGPVILNALLASSRFKHIVLSDLVEDNRLELNKWLKKDEDAIDWTFRAEMVAALEGYGYVGVYK